MPSQAELNAQNNASRARQQARRGIEQSAPQVQQPRVQQPYVNPYGGQYGTDSIQDQGYYNDYYDDEEMTDEEWAAYLAGLEASQVPQDVPPYYSDYGSRMPDGPIEAPYMEREPNIVSAGFSGGGDSSGEEGSSWWDNIKSRFSNDFNAIRGGLPGSLNFKLPQQIQQPEQEFEAPEAETPFLQSLKNIEKGESNEYGNSPQRNYYDFVQRGGQMNDEQLRQANEVARSMGTTFDPETGYSRQPYLDYQEQGPQVQPPMSVRDTQDMLYERFGSPTVSGNMNPSMSGLETDAQGRMIPGGYEDRIEAYLPYEQNRYQREVDQANRRDFSTPYLSGADTRDERNEMPDFRTIARQAGVKGGAVNEQAKILEAQWRSDRRQEAANSPESVQANVNYKNAQTAKILAELDRDSGMSEFDKNVVKDLIPEYNQWRTNDEAQSQSNINILYGIIESLDTGDIETGGFINKLPVFSDQMRVIFDESGQDAVDRIRGVAFQSLRSTLGAQFTENEAKNLVATYFNPALSSAMNMERLSEFSKTMQSIHNSTSSMYQYMDENQSLKGYKPQSGRGMVESLVNSGSSNKATTARSSNRTSSGRSSGGGGFEGTTKSGAKVTIIN
jgi:hypothetical protein